MLDASVGSDLFFSRASGIDYVGASRQECVACQNTSGNILLSVPSDPVDAGPMDAWTLYTQCANCASLNIFQPLEDPGRYYGSGYYSHRKDPHKGFRGKLAAMRDAGLVFGGIGPSALLALARPDVRLRQLRPLIDGRFGRPLRRDSAILDVGCGAGRWLQRLADIGFQDLTGCDPFLENEHHEPGLRLLKSDIRAVEGTFDLIVISHALEHVRDPRAEMRELMRRLAPGGVLMVRIPLLNRFAWLEYGGFWVQLDAPRHQTLFTRSGFETLVGSIGLNPVHVVFDASEFMVLGSMARRQGLFPHGSSARWNDAIREMGRSGRKAARKIAKATNLDGSSDQATFYLKATLEKS